MKNQARELSFVELGAVSGGAQSDYLLTIDGIKGESQDDKHKDDIHLESFRAVRPKT